jgi:hypothetical protein
MVGVEIMAIQDGLMEGPVEVYRMDRPIFHLSREESIRKVAYGWIGRDRAR